MAETPWKYALVDINDLKDDLRITGTEFDDRLMRIVNGVSQAVERWTNRQFRPRVESSAVDGDGTEILLLKAPIISITSIVNYTTTLTYSATPSLSDYQWYAETGKVVLTNGTVWCGGSKNVTPAYRHGYEDQDMPQDVLTATRMWCLDTYQKIQDKRIGVSSVSKEQGSITYLPADMPAEVKLLLQPYRILGYMG